MEQNINNQATAGANVQKFQVKLKFAKSEQNGALISYVSQNPANHWIRGVGQDSPYPKKIVIADRELSKSMLPKILYDCTIIPMIRVLHKDTGEKYAPGYIAIRPLTLSRKNFLFCGNHEAAENTAVICSLLATCKAQEVNPREWLNDVITRLPYYQEKETPVKTSGNCFRMSGSRRSPTKIQ